MLDGHQPMGHWIKLGESLGLGHSAQRAVKIIGPAMKRADHGTLAAPILARDHAGAAMPADIVEGAHDVVFAAQYQSALAGNVEGRPVALPGNVAHMAGELPVAPEQLLLLDVEELLIEIGPGRKAGALLVGEMGRRHEIDRVHY